MSVSDHSRPCRNQSGGKGLSGRSVDLTEHELDAIILPEEKRNPYKRCRTGIEGCYLAPVTDPAKRIDGKAEKHLVGQETVGRTHFRLQDRPPWERNDWRQLKTIDDGNAHLTYAGETTKGPYRVNDREVYTTRRAESVACQVGLSDGHRQEMSRLIAETDLRPWNWLGGIDAAIVGAIAYVLNDGRYVVSRSECFSPNRLISGPEDALEHPAVQDAVDMLGVEKPDKTVAFAYKKFR